MLFHLCDFEFDLGFEQSVAQSCDRLGQIIRLSRQVILVVGCLPRMEFSQRPLLRGVAEVLSQRLDLALLGLSLRLELDAELLETLDGLLEGVFLGGELFLKLADLGP